MIYYDIFYELKRWKKQYPDREISSLSLEKFLEMLAEETAFAEEQFSEVYSETPDEKYCFRHAACQLPEYKARVSHS